MKFYIAIALSIFFAAPTSAEIAFAQVCPDEYETPNISHATRGCKDPVPRESLTVAGGSILFDYDPTETLPADANSDGWRRVPQEVCGYGFQIGYDETKYHPNGLAPYPVVIPPHFEDLGSTIEGELQQWRTPYGANLCGDDPCTHSYQFEWIDTSGELDAPIRLGHTTGLTNNGHEFELIHTPLFDAETEIVLIVAYEKTWDANGNCTGWNPKDLNFKKIRVVGIDHPDYDGDGILNEDDNCINVANSALGFTPSPYDHVCGQQDADNDGYGNACDSDTNNDGATGMDDLSAVNICAKAVGQVPNLDLNCDGACGQDDTSRALREAQLITRPGPSGIACAGTVPCP